MDTKLSAMNLAMAKVLRDAEPKSISRREAAERMSVTEGQLNRLLGGNPKYVRDISVTVLYELADVWGVSVIDLVRRAEALLDSQMSGDADTPEASDGDYQVTLRPPQADDVRLAAKKGQRK